LIQIMSRRSGAQRFEPLDNLTPGTSGDHSFTAMVLRIEQRESLRQSQEGFAGWSNQNG
jgi:hypothetical protein